MRGEELPGAFRVTDGKSRASSVTNPADAGWRWLTTGGHMS